MTEEVIAVNWVFPNSFSPSSCWTFAEFSIFMQLSSINGSLTQPGIFQEKKEEWVAALALLRISKSLLITELIREIDLTVTLIDHLCYFIFYFFPFQLLQAHVLFLWLKILMSWKFSAETHQIGNTDYHPRTPPREARTATIQPIAVPAIPINEMKAITDNFGSNNLVGEGSYGRVFHGVLRSGRAVAIKKLDSSKQPDQEFLSQVCSVPLLCYWMVCWFLM